MLIVEVRVRYCAANMSAMCFIDGENLVFRYQDMLKNGAVKESNVEHIQDVFVWHLGLASFLPFVRVNYYTSAVGDDCLINDMRDQIGKVHFHYGDEAARVCAHVFKKPAETKKSKIVDITLAIDALRHAHDANIDVICVYSGDADFVPLVREIMRTGKRVFVGALSSGLAPEMTRIPDRFIDLDYWIFPPALNPKRKI